MKPKKKKTQLAAAAMGVFLALTAISPSVLAAEPGKGSIMLDTSQYRLAPGNQYTIGAFVKDPSGKQLSASEVRSLVSQGKLGVRDSRTGSIVDLEQLPSGHFRVTGKNPGTCWIVYEIGGTHASVRIDVQNGVRQHGTAVRNTSLFTRDIFGTSSPSPAPSPDPSVFDLTKGTVMLNNGLEMPVLGIGTYRLSQTQAENSVYWALRDGYRLIDTARIYGNEEGVGRGIRRAIQDGFVTREEIFVTTKMWTADYDNPTEAIDASLRRLGLDYIDLMILHHSQPSNDVTAYQAMEQAVREGKLRSIGLSNYYTPQDFDRLVRSATVRPALLQNETHPYHQSTEMKEHLKQYGIVMESWFPLGGRGNTQRLFQDETISAIAKNHNKTSAQIILRWHLQAGNIAIPGSSNETHIRENHDIFDFELTDQEMARLTALNKNERFASY